MAAGGRYGDAGRGVGERHAQYIGQRQHEGARRGDVGAVAGDDSGQDRHHGQNAGRERQQQPQTEKGAKHQHQIAVADQRRQAILLGNERRRPAVTGAAATVPPPAAPAGGSVTARVLVIGG